MTRGAGDDGLPLGAWLLLVALVYATLQKGAFDRGPFLVVLALLAAAAAAHRLGGGRMPLVPALAALTVGAIGISVLATDADLRSAAPTLAMTAAVLATIGVVAGLRPPAVVRVVDGVVLCGLVVAATAWIGVAFHRDPWGLVAQDIWRGSSTLTYANATGALAGIALLLALARLRPEANRLAVLPAYGLAVGVLSTGSRAALLAVAVGVVVLARRTSVTALVPVLLGALVGAAALIPSLAADGPARPGIAVAGLLLGAAVAVVGGRVPALVLAVLAVAAVAVTAGGNLDALASARFDLGSEDRAAEWRAATDEFGSSPVVGVGPGHLDLSWEGEDGRTYVAAFTHNEYLELLGTHGLVGAVALAACVVVVVRRRPRGRPSTDHDGALAALAVLAVHSGFDFLWHIPVLALVGGVLVGVVSAAADPETEPTTSSSRELELQT